MECSTWCDACRQTHYFLERCPCELPRDKHGDLAGKDVVADVVAPALEAFVVQLRQALTRVI